MTPSEKVLGLSVLFALGLTVYYAVQSARWERKANTWMSRYVTLEGALDAMRYRSTQRANAITSADAKVARFLHDLAHGFPDEFPSHLPIGTASNPILLGEISRPFADPIRPRGDRAVYLELDAICPTVIE